MPKFPILVADIGGTHARFAWVAGSHAQPSDARTLKVSEFESPSAAAQFYLESLSQTLGSRYEPPRQAAFAVAASLRGDWASFTNSAWSFSCKEIQAALGLDHFLALNDFEALAYALPHLAVEKLRAWDGTWSPGPGNLAVLGPGTGLGVAGLIKTLGGWQAVPGEGGHMTLAPFDDFESEIFAKLRKDYRHVSAERLLSGLGLPLLHQTILQLKGLSGNAVSTEVIVSAGLAGEVHAHETLGVFCALLGGFAGNVALTLGARGGVFIGGGIVPRLGDFFFESKFKARFEAKGRFDSYLKEIPVVLILDTDAAMLGALRRLELAQSGKGASDGV